MYKVEDFVIALYCLIEDELYPHFCHHYGRPRRSGFSPSLSDSECLTIEVVGHFLGIRPRNSSTSRCTTDGWGGFPRSEIACLSGTAPTCGRSKPGCTTTSSSV